MSTSELPRFDALRVELAGKIVVEASAGTGKTHAITTLVLRLVLESKLEPFEILVMTFTEAATAELRTRIRRRLGLALGVLSGSIAPAELDDPELAALCEKHAGPEALERMKRAVDNADEAPITTIHGFCHRVLHDQALGTKTRFSAELVPDLEELYDDVLYDFWHARVANDPELVEALSGTKADVGWLRRLLLEARRHPDARVVPEPLDPVGELEHEFLSHATREVLRQKELRGVLGFDDLLERVRAAVSAPGADAVVRGLRQRYRAVLVDEFQDTDPVQWEIVERAFGNAGPLLLIGDPKQAIYSFRGGDVFTYLDAARGARRFSMGVNWRSDPGMIAAVNQVFRGENPFLIEEIRPVRVVARPDAADCFHAEHASGEASLELLLVEREGETLPAKAKAERAVARVVAADVARSLASATIEGKRITARDVAVLTRTNDQCFIVQEALRQRGIHAVVIGDKNVFASSEALELELVLLGVLEPGSSSARKRALTTTIVGERGESIAALDEDVERLEHWLLAFQRWNRLWNERGFMRMFREILRDTGAAERFLELAGGERSLTNLLHLSELLQRAVSEEHLGPAALAAWLGEQRGETSSRSEHTEIRLESDEDAVRLLTVHKAKGLEFPIVYAPFLWSGLNTFNVQKPRVIHHEGETFLDIDRDKERRSAHVALYNREQLAEDLRLAYVALTRAEHRTTVVWGWFRGLSTSATGFLLHPDAQLARGTLPKTNRLDKLSDAEIARDLAGIAQASSGAIALRRVPFGYDAPALERAALVTPLLPARSVAARVLHWERTESFSGLSQHEPLHAPEAAERDHDEDAEAARPAPAKAPAERKPIVLREFPRGPRAGDFFHALFEVLDFANAKPDEILELAEDKLEGFGFGRGVDRATQDVWLSEVLKAVRDTLDTPLGTGGFRLADVPNARRFNELEFRVPVAPAAPGSALDPRRLADVFRRHPSPELPRHYAERVEALGFASLNGYLKGYIDLVFEHDGRFYVVDYKTNHLGDFSDEYHPTRLAAAMTDSHYFLQYHLYSLAVDRFLRRFQPGYDYERGFGGVYYLFIKGMRPDATTGVFFEKPPRARMEALSAALGGEGP
ncbi:MAG TPA: UvrD-helicase domain-containing protein [Polyangiaceae bacterium]